MSYELLIMSYARQKESFRLARLPISFEQELLMLSKFCLLKAAGLLRSTLPAILPYIFYEHSYFQTIAVFSCRPPHTQIRQQAAKSGKKWQYYIAQSGHGARITHQTPVSCVIMCKNYLSLCKSVQ